MGLIVAVISVALPILIVGLFAYFYIFERWRGTRTAIVDREGIFNASLPAVQQ